MQQASNAGTQPGFLPVLLTLPFQFPVSLHHRWALLVEEVLLWLPRVNQGWWIQVLSPHLGECHLGLEVVSQDLQLPLWLPGPGPPVLLTADLGMKKTSFEAGGHGGALGGLEGTLPRLRVPTLLAPLGFLAPRVRGVTLQHEAQEGPHSCPLRWPSGGGSCLDDFVLAMGVL